MIIFLGRRELQSNLRGIRPGTEFHEFELRHWITYCQFKFEPPDLKLKIKEDQWFNFESAVGSSNLLNLIPDHPGTRFNE